MELKMFKRHFISRFKEHSANRNLSFGYCHNFDYVTFQIHVCYIDNYYEVSVIRKSDAYIYENISNFIEDFINKC